MDAEEQAAEKEGNGEGKKKVEIVRKLKWHRVKVLVSEDTHAFAALVDGRVSGHN